LPQELNKAEREKLVDELCNKIVERHNVIVDAAIHAPHTDSGSDERNYHAHIMFTGRQIDLETGDFAAKKNRDFNKENSSETVQKWCEDFADMTNRHLEQIGSLERVDHRSNVEQGIALEATAHEGSAVTKLRRLGIDTEISLSNDAIKQRNAQQISAEQAIRGLEQEIIASERIIAKLEQQQAEQRTAAAPRAELDQLEQNYDAIKQRNSEIEGQIKHLEANEPPANIYGMFVNKDHTDWAIRLATLQTDLEQGQRKQDDALRTVINHPIYKQELSDHINNSENLMNDIAAETQKNTFEHVYQNLKIEQNSAFNDL
jgi:hypothetical protein